MDAVTARPTATAADLTIEDPGVVAERLRHATSRLARRLRQEAGSGLTPSQQAALATIGGRGPLSLGALADEEQITPPSATKLVDKLEAAGLVERRADPGDRRVAQVALTRQGRTTLDALRARKTAWLAQRLAEVDVLDLARLADAVDVLERLAGPPADDGGDRR